MKHTLLLIISLFFIGFSSFATHNRAGEISYKKVNPNDPFDYQYEITIVTCTKSSSPADRPYLNIRFGDEAPDQELDSLERSEIIQDVNADAQLNYYSTIHTYPGAGSYLISMEDPNRNGGVINMDESISQVFYIESLLIINPILGHNNSVSLLYPAKDEACTNSRWEHNPGAFDLDGDSLVYSLEPCRGFGGTIIPSWEIPNAIGGNLDQEFSINPLTGTVVWENPIIAGEYNIAIKIEEFRSGFLVGYVIRDMQINVLNCENDPPNVTIIQDTCIVAGNFLSLGVTATDNSSTVTLSAVGAPLTEVENIATFTSSTGNPANGTFSWTPECSEVRPAPYQVLIVGEDNESNSTDLVDIMEVNISVIAPEVENLELNQSGLSFELTWDDHQCSEVLQYKIYRRSGFFGYEPGFCETGVPAYTGYTLLNTVNAPVTSYLDSENVDFGSELCYMVVACLANGSESIASEEVCGEIPLILPVITKVSVGATDLLQGRDTVRWAPPVEADTTLLVSPYRYRLYHEGSFNTAETEVYTSDAEEFISSLPTEFIHENINTLTTPNAYRVVLEDANAVSVSSQVSSSQFLQLTPNDNELTLNWQANTSWVDTAYQVYKLDEFGEYQFLEETTQTSFTDTSLVNNSTYCYYVLALGTFNSSIEELPNPTINLSQEVCAFPVDLTAPCPPEVNYTAECEDGTVEINWVSPNDFCSDDAIQFNIYFKPFIESEYELLETITDPLETTFTYVNETNLTGCFYVTALDSVLPGLDGPNQNESLPSLEFCSESCPEYELPNVFSPQGDTFNDSFGPFPYAYVDSIDLTIYNRWGTPVFETKDPDINWTGLNKDSGAFSSDGVYFYEITIYTSLLTGIMEEKRSGTITLLDGEKQFSE